MTARNTLLAASIAALVSTSAFAQNVRPEGLAALGPPPIPADNPQTPEKIELGKMLFFDPILSGNGAMPCSACHHAGCRLGRSGQDLVRLSGHDALAEFADHHQLGLLLQTVLGGSSKSLEGQARSAARGAVAGNGEDDMMEARLAFVPEYRERFRDVFGDDWPLVRHAYMALASFQRTLVQTDTPFDTYMNGDDDALTDAQKRGLELFAGKANCIACHTGPLLSDEQFHNLGVPPYDGWETDELAQITFRFELFAKGSTEEMYRSTKDDPGLYFRSKEKSHKGKFRTPSLRYTKYTFPYMHNGMLETLRDVVVFYNEGGGENEFAATKSPLMQPLDLTDEEIDDLVAFLESLSGDEILMDEPDLPQMEALPAVAQN